MSIRTPLRAAATAVALAASSLATAAPAAAAPSGPVVIDTHTSVHPPEVYSLTSSASGTVYGSDRKGGSRMFFRAAPLASGTVDVDLGPNPSRVGDPAIVGDKIAIPVDSGTDDRIIAVRWCTAGSCAAPLASIAVPATENYLANTGTGILLYATDGTRQLRIRPYAGGAPQIVGTLPGTPSFPDGIEAQADPAGAVLNADDVYYLDFAASTVTPLHESGGAPLSANEVALSPHFLAGQLFTGSATIVSRFSRSALTAPSETFTAGPDFAESLTITDAGTAWIVQSEDSAQHVFTRTAGGATTTEYVRPLSLPALSPYEDTGDFLVADRAAPTPGFYRVAPAASAGTFVGVLGTRYARTAGLALSTDRVLYADDSTTSNPLFLRDVSGLPTLGGETTVSSASSNEGYPKDISGPLVAFARPNATTPTRTDIGYGRPGSALSTLTLPLGDDVWSIQVSGSRALILGRPANRLLNLVTGDVASVASGVYARLWGDYLVTLGINNALLQRRNLVTGAIATIRAADPACPAFCVDEDANDLEVWGNQVAYRFTTTAGALRTGVWTATSATTGTVAPFPAPGSDTYDFAMSDGLLFTQQRPDDRMKLYDLRAGTNALVDTFATVYPYDVDGYRVGWIPASDYRGRVADVRKYLPGYTLSAPRLLTAAAPAAFAVDGPARWRPRFFATRNVAWQLQLHSGGATGPVVRSFSDTSAFGEITPAGGWDGRDGFGAAVPQGTYTWTLTGSADSLALKFADGTTTRTGTVYVSRTPPATPVVSAPTRSTDTSATTSFGISWSSPGAPAGTRYTVRTSTNGGALTTLLSATTSTSTTVTATAGQTRRFSVTATDPAGRVSATGTATTQVPYDDTSAGVTGTWTTVTAASKYRGSERTSGSAGAVLAFSATGTSISVIGDKGPSHGQFQVSYDGGAYSPAIDTVASTSASRRVLTTKTFTGAAASHTVKVRVVGTAGRPTVAVDGIAYLR